MSDEERIRDYLRRRADVTVPVDLRWPSSESQPRHAWAIDLRAGWFRVAAGAAVAGVIAISLLVGLVRLAPPPGPAATSTAETVVATTAAPDSTFPREIDGMSVISVARALELLSANKLDGAAVAVAGYYGFYAPSCPGPRRYIGPLETWCDFSAFADTPGGARLCTSSGNSLSCRQPDSGTLRPFFMPETSMSSALGGRATFESPAPLVLIGHAGDPRQWQCTIETQEACARAFVVDRIAWADGHVVPLAVAETGDQQTGMALPPPRMSLEQVVRSIDADHLVVAAAPFRAGDVPLIAPGWSISGDALVWLVRSTFPVQASAKPLEREEMVWLVDDATGRIIERAPMKVDPPAQLARVWLTATVHGYACCPGDLFPFAEVQSGGQVDYLGRVSGGAMGQDDSTTFGGGYGSRPLVLRAGTYAVSIWLSEDSGGGDGSATRQCSTELTVAPLESVTLDAEFPVGGECSFQEEPAPAPAT